jgi:4-hydroxybenzoate polyprenyltransferase
MNNLVQSLRPYQWPKQSIVVIPILSLGKSLSVDTVLHGLVAAITFSFIASLVYIINDYFDLEEDRSDPIRKNRPLAAGAFSQSHAKILVIVLFCVGFAINTTFASDVLSTTMLLLLYLFLNLAYSKFQLKNQGILGISIVASGFPLRFAFGCLYLNIQISFWALAMLMQLSLFMLSVKRYQRTIRKTTTQQNVASHEFWLLAATIFAAFFSASYAGFISSPTTQEVWGSTALLLSAIPLALAIVRFLEVATQPINWKSSDVTDSVLKDFPMVFLTIAYCSIMLLGSLTNVK